jgi:two-component system, NarL family, invasion response regulator UvrY
MSERGVRVLLVDDHLVVRQGFRTMLAGAPDLEVAGEAASGAEALDLVAHADFDVVCLDIALPDTSGLDLLKTLKQRWPPLPVVVISMYSEAAYSVRAIKLGASAYLTKTTEPETLFAAIRHAAAGRKFVPPDLGARLAEALSQQSTRGGHASLSEREFEVLRRIVRGQSLAEIATELHVSAKTVTTYRSRILDKLGLRGNADLVRYAMDQRIAD